MDVACTEDTYPSYDGLVLGVEVMKFGDVDDAPLE